MPPMSTVEGRYGTTLFWDINSGRHLLQAVFLNEVSYYSKNPLNHDEKYTNAECAAELN